MKMTSLGLLATLGLVGTLLATPAAAQPRVRIGPGGSVAVDTPGGTSVRTGKGGTRVVAPGAEVTTDEGGTTVRTDAATVRTGGAGSEVSAGGTTVATGAIKRPPKGLKTRKPLVCKGNEDITLRKVVIVTKGDGLTVRGNCDVTLVDSHINNDAAGLH